MRVIDIVEGTIVDGPGLRTSIYFAGCGHQCPGCHNPQSWDIESGKEMSVEEILRIIEENGFNVSFSGGDPLYQIDNGLIPLAKAIKEKGFEIWCYTGYTIEQIEASDTLRPILDCVDVIVDGPFIESERDTSLRFRGSRNQRIIKLPFLASNVIGEHR